MTPVAHFDIAVIGTGSGNSILDERYAGKRVAICEQGVFGGTCLVTAAIYAFVILLATGERARAFKAMSPGMLPSLGILFGLFVAFTAAQVWSDNPKSGS